MVFLFRRKCFDQLAADFPLQSQGSSFNPSQGSEDVLLPPDNAVQRARKKKIKEINNLLEQLGMEPLSTKYSIEHRENYIQRKVKKDSQKLEALYTKLLLNHDHDGANESQQGDEAIHETDDECLSEVSVCDYVTLLTEAKDQFSACDNWMRQLQLVSLTPLKWSRPQTAAFFNCSDYMVRKAQNLRCSVGPGPPGEKKRGNALSEETRTSVVNFYRKEHISTIIGGMTNTVCIGNDEYLPKRLLLFNINEALQLFRDENPSHRIGTTSFAKLRPKDVILADEKAAHITSQCQRCENMRLILGAQEEIKSIEELMWWASCDKSDEGCMTGSCQECKDLTQLREHLLYIMSESQQVEVSYKSWNTSADRCDLNDNSCSVEEYIDNIITACKNHKTHYFVKTVQRLSMKRLREELKEDEAIILMDFAENYSYVSQREVAAKYYKR